MPQYEPERVDPPVIPVIVPEPPAEPREVPRATESVDEALDAAAERSLDEPEVESSETSLVAPPSEDREARGLRVGALVFACLGVAFALVDARAHLLRLLLSTAATALLLVLLVLRGPRRTSSLDAAFERDLRGALAPAALAALASVAAAWILHALAKPGFYTAVSSAAWVVLAAATAELTAHIGMRNTLDAARGVIAALHARPLPELGAVIELLPGDATSADLRVVSGSVTIEQWGLASLRAVRHEGEPIPAGAVVREGTAQARVIAVDGSRAFVRLLTDALERSDRAAPALRALDRGAPWVAAAVVLLAIGLGLVSRGKLGPTVAAGLAAGASILIPPARRLAVRDQLRGIVEACRRGAAFRDADAFVEAGRVRTAVFCARGTLLAMHPDGFDVDEAAGIAGAADVLALAAGAERGIDHPIAIAIAKAAATRGVRPIDVRNVSWDAGLGVVGELAPATRAPEPRAPSARVADVVVGGRALCIREHVATAEHEMRIAELESRGREVVLVARGGRIIGLLALHYPLRSGALAAAQRLHDVDVEPVLLGGGARERLEAVGKNVDIDHVRPEVLPKDRAAEVRRIAQSGGTVAVIGRMPVDSVALGAADVAIALGDAGTPAETRDGARPNVAIALVHDNLVAAVDVIALAQATRARVVATLTVGLVPAVIAALPVAFGLVRPAIAPLAALAATVALAVRDLVAAALPEGGRIDDTR